MGGIHANFSFNALKNSPVSHLILDFSVWRLLITDSVYLLVLGLLRFSISFWVNIGISSVQLLSRVWLFATPRTAALQAALSITSSWSLLKLMSIESVMPSNHFILCPLLLLLPSIFPSIRVFSNEPVLHIRWPKYWSFSFTISPSSECLLNFFPISSKLVCWCINWFTVSLIILSFFARLVVMSPCSFVSFFLLIQPS